MRVMVIELQGTYKASWIDGSIKDGWTPHFPASTIIDPNNNVRHFLTLTKKED